MVSEYVIIFPFVFVFDLLSLSLRVSYNLIVLLSIVFSRKQKNNSFRSKLCFACYNYGMENKLLTTAQVAKKLGLSIGRVRQLISAGRLTAQQFGRVFLVAEKDVKNFESRPSGRPPKEVQA
jgi:excisionase family DNA binding protein